MKRSLLGLFVMILGLCFVIGDMSSVFAQATEEFTLEEITVTAQKREENSQKVPIAMETFSGSELQELGKNDIQTILDTVSSVIINTASDGYRVSIRGISNDNPQFQGLQASTPTVAVNTDGIYTNRNSSGQGLYDVERVEVLMGPQSTLYASASPGGIVNIVTANPKTDKYEGSASIEYGDYNLFHTEGAFNAPMSDKLALRGAFSLSTHDGYVSDGTGDEDTKSGRLKFLYQPDEKLSFLVTGEIGKRGGKGGFPSVEAFVNQDDDTYPDGTKLKDPWTAASSSIVSAGATDRISKKISGNITWDTGYAGTLTIVPSYSKETSYNAGMKNLGMGADAAAADVIEEGNGWEKGVEARMSSSEDFLFQWILGGNIYKAYDYQSQTGYYTADDDDDADSIQYRWNKQDTKALYGNITYPVTDRFRATAGLRQTWDKNTTYNQEWPGPGGGTRIDAGEPMEYDDPSYKLGAEYDIAENSMFYGSWSTSYRNQGMASINAGQVFPPEELSAYTVGAKNRFFGNKLQLNTSIYYYDYKNYFANGSPLRVPNDPADYDGSMDDTFDEPGVKQVGDATVYGLDLQTSTIITDKDKLDFSMSYIKKEFKDLVFAYTWQAHAIGLEDVDYSNKQMPNAPKWTFKATYSHNFMLPNGGILTPRIETKYQSSYVLDWAAKSISYNGDSTSGYTVSITDTSDVRVQEAYHMENFSLIYAHPDGKWTLTAWLNNVMNYAVKTSYMQNSLNIGDPRAYGAVLSVRY